MKAEFLTGFGGEGDTMAQVKKEAVRRAILDNAHNLFKRLGYSNTSVSQIAKAAGVSTSNIYVYFPSKLRIFFAIYDPWLRQRLERLERELADIDDASLRLRKILRAVWHEIPAEDGGFPNNLMQALSTGSLDEGYERDLLLWSEDKISELIARNIPESSLNAAELSCLSHIVFMAHDGFAMNYHLRGPSRRIEAIIELTVSLLLDRPRSGRVEARHATVDT